MSEPKLWDEPPRRVDMVKTRGLALRLQEALKAAEKAGRSLSWGVYCYETGKEPEGAHVTALYLQWFKARMADYTKDTEGKKPRPELTRWIIETSEQRRKNRGYI